MPSFPLITKKAVEDDLKKIESKSKNMTEVLDTYLGKYPQLRKVYGAWMRSY